VPRVPIGAGPLRTVPLRSRRWKDGVRGHRGDLTTIDKLLAREIAHAQELKARLESQIADYEERYQLKSSAFYRQYQNGKMGDDMDFVEWAATVEMLHKAEKRLALLQQESVV